MCNLGGLHVLAVFVVRGNTRVCFHGWSAHDQLLEAILVYVSMAGVRMTSCLLVTDKSRWLRKFALS